MAIDVATAIFCKAVSFEAFMAAWKVLCAVTMCIANIVVGTKCHAPVTTATCCLSSNVSIFFLSGHITRKKYQNNQPWSCPGGGYCVVMRYLKYRVPQCFTVGKIIRLWCGKSNNVVCVSGGNVVGALPWGRAIAVVRQCTIAIRRVKAGYLIIWHSCLSYCTATAVPRLSSHPVVAQQCQLYIYFKLHCSWLFIRFLACHWCKLLTMPPPHWLFYIYSWPQMLLPTGWFFGTPSPTSFGHVPPDVRGRWH